MGRMNADYLGSGVLLVRAVLGVTSFLSEAKNLTRRRLRERFGILSTT